MRRSGPSRQGAGLPRWVPVVLSLVVFAGAAQFLFVAARHGRSHGSSDPLIQAVKNVWVKPVTFTVDKVRLVAVTADPTAGCCSADQAQNVGNVAWQVVAV